LIGAERVDFVSIPVTDKERAMQFYGETVGLERDPKSSSDWAAFFRDPDGNGLMPHHRYAPFADGTTP
jgi:predicted enzyme related to lactoylglutathione lyase